MPSRPIARASFSPGLLGIVALEDAGLGLDDLRERPEGHAVAVGEGAALSPGDELDVLVDRPEELGDEPALADAGHADERDELWRALLAHARQRRDEQLELAAAADERRRCRLVDVDAETGAGRQRLPGADRVALPLAEDRLGVAVVDRMHGGAVGLLADEDAVQWRSRLQARRGVDDVARPPSPRLRSVERRA